MDDEMPADVGEIELPSSDFGGFLHRCVDHEQAEVFVRWPDGTTKRVRPLAK